MSNIPNIRFKGFNDPWKQRKLEDSLLELKSGLSRMLSNDDIGIPVVRANNISNGVVDMDKDVKYWYEKDPQGAKTENYLVEKGDILINFINSEAKMGTAALIQEKMNRKTIFTTNILRARINDNYDKNFYFQLTFTEKYRNDIKIITKPAVNQASFTTVDYKNLIYYFPIKDEQMKIGRFLYKIDNLITLHQSKCDELKELKKYMLQKFFPKKDCNIPEIRFNGYTEPWEQRKLGDIGTTFTGLSGKTKEDFGHGNAKFITYMNVFSNPIADLEMVESIEIDLKQNCVRRGDVFFTTSSETPEEVGMSCVMPENAENIYLNSFCFGYRPSIIFDLNYLAYVLRAKSFRSNMIFLAQGISRYNISKNKVMDVEIPVSSLAEQNKVGSYFRNLDNLITLHQRKCDELKEMKKYMLSNMFPKGE